MKTKTFEKNGKRATIVARDSMHFYLRFEDEEHYFTGLSKRNGVDGILFSKYDTFSEKHFPGNEVLYSLPEDVVSWFGETQAKLRQAEKEEKEKDIHDGLKEGRYVYCYMKSGSYLIDEEISVIRHATSEEKEEYKEEWREGLCGHIETRSGGKIRDNSETLTKLWENFEGRRLHFFGGGESSGIPLTKEEYEKIVGEVKTTTEEKQAVIDQKNQKYRDELKKLQEGKLREARETGRNVIVRRVGGYDGDVESPGNEFGWVIVNEVATPEGKIITTETPTY